MKDVLTFICKSQKGEIQILNWWSFDTKNLIKFTSDMIHNLAEFEPYKIERTENDDPIIKVTIKDNSFSIWSSEKKRESIKLLSNAILICSETL